MLGQSTFQYAVALGGFGCQVTFMEINLKYNWPRDLICLDAEIMNYNDFHLFQPVTSLAKWFILQHVKHQFPAQNI